MANPLDHKRVTMVGGSRVDRETRTASVQALEVEGEGMTARTRRYECLFPGNLQGAVHMRTKGTTRRKVVFAQDEHGDPETALAEGQVPNLVGHDVYHLGAILDHDVRHEQPAACRCVTAGGSRDEGRGV